MVLTPVAPGNQRSAVWSEQTLNHETWVADVDFRASGPERGGGNLNIWLTAGGAAEMGSSSIYTAGRFEGLGIVVDASGGGTGGMIRGFLNDGTVDFSSGRDLDGLVFGQCRYAYRNLGRPSQIKLRQGVDNFKVEIDGRLCFESDEVQMPAGYKWGITAATPDNPDSFEIFKLVVMSEKPGAGSANANADNGNKNQQRKQKPKPKQQQQQQQQKKKPKPKAKEEDDSQFAARDDIPDETFDLPDDDLDTTASQLADLHNRIQTVNQHASSIHRTLSKSAQTADKRHTELTKMLNEFRSDLRRLEALGGMGKKLEALEKEVKGLKGEVANKMKASEKTLKSVLTDHHATLKDNIVAAAPGNWGLIGAIVASQVVLVGLYVWYKRRQNDMPKKYV